MITEPAGPAEASVSRQDAPSGVEAALLAATLERLEGAVRRPFVLGLAGSQGSGKSTAADALSRRLRGLGLRAAVLSLDDLYLPLTKRARLAAEVHPLLLTRGPPGTHDVRLGCDLIEALARPGATPLPRFDKAADDRQPAAEWEKTAGPLDVLVFEGWCVAAKAEPEAALAEPINRLEREEDADGRWRRWVNGQLAGSYQALFARIDLLAFLAAPSFEVVAAWRTEQEEALRRRLKASGAETGALMNPVEIGRFVQFYERLTRWMLQQAPGYADLTLRLDERRRLLPPAR